jgi:hypothetical protein
VCYYLNLYGENAVEFSFGVSGSQDACDCALLTPAGILVQILEDSEDELAQCGLQLTINTLFIIYYIAFCTIISFLFIRIKIKINYSIDIDDVKIVVH